MGVNIVYAYDEAGRLIAEFTDDSTTKSGALFLYLEGAVVAVVPFTVPPGQPVQHLGVFHVYPDHLDTPRLVTDSQNQARWRWDPAEPFGSFPANENPTGLGVFLFNMRFPGQYFDKETNTHYNYFRDYDAAIGRYVQSDPIGLAGGINTYAYVDGNPLSLVDPLGQVPVGSIPTDPNQPAIFYNVPRRGALPACGPDDDCPNPITITTEIAGLGPTSYFPRTTTTTYSATCLIRLGLGLKATSTVVGTVAIQQGPTVLPQIGMPTFGKLLKVIRPVANNPATITASGVVAGVAIMQQCECKQQ